MNFFCVAKKMGLLTSFRVAVAPLRLVGALRRRRVPSPCPAIASAAVDLAIFFCLFSRKRDRSSRDNGTARHLAAARLPRLPCASRPAVCDARAHFASLVSSPVSLSRHSFSDGGSRHFFCLFSGVALRCSTCGTVCIVMCCFVCKTVGVHGLVCKVSIARGTCQPEGDSRSGFPPAGLPSFPPPTRAQCFLEFSFDYSACVQPIASASLAA